MPRVDQYTEELSKLAQSNFLNGIEVFSRAELLKNQNQATLDTLTEFNRQKALIDGEVKTTEQQVKELSDSNLFQTGSEDIEKAIVNLQTGIENSLSRQQMFTDLSQRASLQLESIGSEESQRMAKMIRQQDIDRLEMTKGYFELQASKLNVVKYQFELGMLQKNNKVNNLAVQMIADEEYQKFRTDYIYNQKSGKTKYSFKDLYDKMYTKYGKEDLFREAYAVASSKLGEPLAYRPDAPDYSGQRNALEKMYGNAQYLVDMYNYLRQTSNFIDDIENNPNYKDVRQAYYDAAVGVYGAQNEKNKNSFNFGADPKVIAKMNQDADLKDVGKVMFGEELLSPTDLATWIYNRKWNQGSSEYYFDVLNEFRTKLKKTDGNSPNFTPYNFDDKEQAYVPNYGSTRIGNRELFFDYSQLISNENGKYWQPASPNNLNKDNYINYFGEEVNKYRRPLQTTSQQKERGIGEQVWEGRDPHNPSPNYFGF